jgi:hypothetical protein
MSRLNVASTALTFFGKFIRWSIYVCALILLVGVLYLGTTETYLYLTRSEPKAEAAAQTLFLKICDRNGFDPNSFQGPERPNLQGDQKTGGYTFVWQKSPEEIIWVRVSYFPYDLPYSISAALSEGGRVRNPNP